MDSNTLDERSMKMAEKKAEEIDEEAATQAENLLFEKEAATKAEKLLSEEVKASIAKREEVFRLRMSARRAEGECDRLMAEIYALPEQSYEWYEKNRVWYTRNEFARQARTKANIIEREAKRIEDGLIPEVKLKYMEDACKEKKEVAKSLRNFAKKNEIDCDKIQEEILNIPPRFRDKLWMKKELLRGKDEAATSARMQASMRDGEIKRLIQEIEKVKAKKLENPKPAIITIEAPNVVAVETSKDEEEVKPIKPPVSWKSRNDKEEDEKTMTLKEYEERKKAVNSTNFPTSAKVNADEDDDSKATKQQGSGKHAEKKGGKPKKCNVMEVLQVSRESFYQKSQQYKTYNPQVGNAATSNYRNHQGRGRGGHVYPRQTNGRNFGGRISSTVAKKEEFPELN